MNHIFDYTKNKDNVIIFGHVMNLCVRHPALDAESLSKTNCTGEIAGQARNDDTQFHMFRT